MYDSLNSNTCHNLCILRILFPCCNSSCFSHTLKLSAKILEKEKRTKQVIIIKDFFQQVQLSSTRFCLYILLETMCLINLALQLWFLDWWLHNAVRNQGIYTLRWFFEEPELRTDPLIALFPRLSNCDMTILGPGTGVTRINAVCVLSFNGVNEAMYLIIFAWLLLLFMITGLFITVTIVVAVIPKFRVTTAAIGLNDKSRQCVSKLLAKNGIGSWFNLMLLKKNESALVLQEFLESVVNEA